ncbi:PP2C family protein-serine/threonine phosphatase [Luethyella okanaganae]|uniref:PP2C family protein-serine/threonine phosphatase n=1 Tax=Luethyella okanaganae TaxID=69372 RepID=A0ABW1VB32_9MICO
MAENGDVEMTLSAYRAHVRFGARTDVGAVRAANEDSILAAMPVFLVADGMGGHARGELASQTVVRVFTEHLAADVPSTPERVLDAIHSANDAVRDLNDVGDVGTAVAGTTLAGVALVDTGEGGYRWMAFNVGDSRVYTWDGRVLGQLSVDHSAVQELVDAGLISEADAERHPERNVITRAIGAEESVDIDLWLIPADGRSGFLVCSDGLSKELDRGEIERVLTNGQDSSELGAIADELVERALASGGRDNISVVLVESTIEAESDDPESTRDRRDRGDENLEDTRPRA